MKISPIFSQFISKTDNLKYSQTHKPFLKPVSLPFDTVSFSSKWVHNNVNVDYNTAEFVVDSLSTSTAGHRAQYNSKTFNLDVVELVTAGIGEYLVEKNYPQGKKPHVLIGGDTREASRESLPLIKDILAKQGVDVTYIKEPIPTPALCLAANTSGIDLAILLTASHNPWEDGGYNLVTNDGAMASVSLTKEISPFILDTAKRGYYATNKARKGEVCEIYPYTLYKNRINSYRMINWDRIKKSNISIYYDGLKGTGEKILPRLLDEYRIPYTLVDSGKKPGPNPTEANLKELKTAVNSDSNELKIGLSTDGDADRFGLIDENGNYISTNDVLLLAAHYLVEDKGIKGDIIRSQATSSQLDLFAQNHGIKVIQTPVGFKYIGDEILNTRRQGEDILIAGEESGGLTIKGHVPEKDGVLVLLMMLDMMALEKKPISQILKETKENIGMAYRMDFINKRFNSDEDKAKIIEKMEKIYSEALNGNTQFGSFEIDVRKTRINAEAMQSYKQNGDGVKLYLTDGSSILVRKSGTEPIVKSYIETYSKDTAKADKKIEELKKEVEKIFEV